ncbi:MAG: LuxR C-terminal-related transcriptional regulator, partial [Syntrophomonadaceae bacterium]
NSRWLSRKYLTERFGLSAEAGLPLGIRLFLLLMVLVITIMLGVIAILIITGIFTAGLSESETLVESELNHTAAKISSNYGELSVQAIEFARQLSQSIEKTSQQLGVPLSQLEEHPHQLDKIIAAQFDLTYLTLQKSKSSGIFFILDATVNPQLKEAEHSKAGLYLKNMEPNVISASAPNIIVLRGFPSIGRSNSLPLDAQWKMEFDTRQAPYYHRPMEAARLHKDLPLSRLYYWTPALALPGTNSEVMICSVPLIDSQGNVFGVCGMDVSAMFFKLSYMPHQTTYNRLFCLLAPQSGSTLNLNQALVSGSYSVRNLVSDNSPLNISKNKRSFYTYRQNNNCSFWGLHTPVRLYPEGSAFAAEKWIAAVLIPEEDLVASVARLNVMLISLLSILVLLGIAAALIISQRFLKPISQGLAIIQSDNLSGAPPTKIPEIDNLINYLATRNRELYEGAREKNLSFSLLDEFVQNTAKLSPSERAVYDLYAKGNTAKEIAEILCLSINTIKTHTKHIYAKLNITSREELLLYVNLLDEINKDLPAAPASEDSSRE